MFARWIVAGVLVLLPADEVAQLIRQLGSEEFDRREEASQRLDAIGEPALAALRVARTEATDPEIRRRASDLVRVIERRVAGERLVLKGHTAKVVGLAVSANGKLAATGADDHTLRVWDLATGKERLLAKDKGLFWSVALTPDGKSVLAGDYDGGVRQFDLATGQVVRAFNGHTAAARALAITPDGKRALSGGYDKKACVLDLETGKILHTLTGHKGSIMAVAVTPDGKFGVTAGDQAEPCLRLWDLATGKEIRRFDGHTERVLGVAVSPDGKTIASGSWDATVRLWDLDSGKALRTLSHPSQVHGVAFAPDGKTVASGSLDGTVRLWEFATGKETARLPGHDGSRVGEVRFAGPRRLLSAGEDGTLRLWETPP